MKSSPEFTGNSIAALFDGQAILDISMRTLLASAGYARKKIDDIMVRFYVDTGEVAEIIKRERANSQEFASKFGSALRLIAEQHLLNTGCPEHGLKFNTEFILEVAGDDPHRVEIPFKGGDLG